MNHTLNDFRSQKSCPLNKTNFYLISLSSVQSSTDYKKIVQQNYDFIPITFSNSSFR